MTPFVYLLPSPSPIIPPLSLSPTSSLSSVFLDAQVGERGLVLWNSLGFKILDRSRSICSDALPCAAMRLSSIISNAEECNDQRED